ncbi:putative membrane protein YwaF [Methylopila capsulata]|uniref:Membrane protein YwaF n=1 Tax=Methylopila capsulata TaxID=61654 RepID=A0A9W6MQL0_9HYPH|nr:hypothetical protein [Methylopila capsulata]MBM7851269.1 putative membrane protein YwaF [Methylopila capsulata]GLK54327.1 hypothetical protein GCM10008170_03460 [Methylopila capsulata]
MHMLMVIVAGIVLLGLFILFGQLWGGTTPALAMAAKIFVPVWLAVSIANLWVGVNKAGYTVAQELPILLVVFAVPAAAAAVAAWQFARS